MNNKIIILKISFADKWKLICEHTYYYQVQAQINVCNVGYGDFVVWTTNDLIMERIAPDQEFYEQMAEPIEHFFIYSILPEIIGKWLTRRPIANEKGVVKIPELIEEDFTEEDMEANWCYCGTPSYGNMVMCDNAKYTIKWFHFDCLRIRYAPRGKWYCPSCRKLKTKSS